MRYTDREAAGQVLGRALRDTGLRGDWVFGIPRGGVAVALRTAEVLRARLDVLVARKLPIPDNPEAGFGAVLADGTLVRNERLLAFLGLREREVGRIAERVRNEVERREQRYRGKRPPAAVEGHLTVLVDDGLATGFTMLAAVRALRRRGASRVVVAAPCASASALDILREEANDVHALQVGYGPTFAVADYYDDFHDPTDDEVLGWLARGGAHPDSQE